MIDANSGDCGLLETCGCYCATTILAPVGFAFYVTFALTPLAGAVYFDFGSRIQDDDAWWYDGAMSVCLGLFIAGCAMWVMLCGCCVYISCSE